MTIKKKTISTNRRYLSIFIGNLPWESVPNHVAGGKGNSNLSRQDAECFAGTKKPAAPTQS